VAEEERTMMLTEDGHAERVVGLKTDHRIKSLAGAMRLKHWGLIYSSVRAIWKTSTAMVKPTKKAPRELRKLWRAPKSHGAKVMAEWLRAERKRRREREQEHRPLAAR
jgi:hypothetical protein